MCEFHDSNGNGFGDIWWTDKLIYFSSIDSVGYRRHSHYKCTKIVNKTIFPIGILFIILYMYNSFVVEFKHINMALFSISPYCFSIVCVLSAM